MINYGRVFGDTRPKEVNVTAGQVFVAKNIEEVTQEIDGYEVSGYQYDYIGYTKDEYLEEVASKDAQRIAELEEQLRVTKILLGVD